MFSHYFNRQPYLKIVEDTYYSVFTQTHESPQGLYTQGKTDALLAIVSEISFMSFHDVSTLFYGASILTESAVHCTER